MNKNSVQKCRTCLKSCTNTFSLGKSVVDCSPEKTYGQLLKEYAKLEYIDKYEHLMPQYICPLCCRELRNLYSFIKQAQKCNSKLLNVISKKLECLREKIIDVPEKGSELISDTSQQKQHHVDTTEARNERSIEQLEKVEGSEDINERIESVDLPLESQEIVTDDNVSNMEESHVVISCPICEEDMDNLEDLKMHMRTRHDIYRANELVHEQTIEVKKVFDCKQRLEAKNTFDCKLCPAKYLNRYSYVYHLIRKHNIDERKTTKELKAKYIKCRSCDYTARTYAALNYHTRAKHGTENDKFKCKFCDYLSVKKFDLLTHVKKMHKELIKTLKADVENSEEIRETSNEAKALTPLELNPSGENSSEDGFSSDDNIPLVGGINNSKRNMQQDKEQFSDEEFIRNILGIKKRDNNSSTLARRCDKCGNIYKNHRALYAHQKQVHITEDKYSLCPHCGKRYKRKTDLRIHIERDHVPKNSNEVSKQPSKVREKRFMCTECSYVCTTITILNIHINRKHTGEKPYKCDICCKSFLVPYDLKIHRYLHTGERPYKCPICSKGFRDNSHMMKHKRIHSSERPFKCKECGKCFALAYYLSVHNRTHLKEKNLNCITCGKVFTSRSLLNLHRINEDHQDEIV